jgi:DNA mismatch repair ATPase MutL
VFVCLRSLSLSLWIAHSFIELIFTHWTTTNEGGAPEAMRSPTLQSQSARQTKTNHWHSNSKNQQQESTARISNDQSDSNSNAQSDSNTQNHKQQAQRSAAQEQDTSTCTKEHARERCYSLFSSCSCCLFLLLSVMSSASSSSSSSSSSASSSSLSRAEILAQKKKDAAERDAKNKQKQELEAQLAALSVDDAPRAELGSLEGSLIGALKQVDADLRKKNEDVPDFDVEWEVNENLSFWDSGVAPANVESPVIDDDLLAKLDGDDKLSRKEKAQIKQYIEDTQNQSDAWREAFRDLDVQFSIRALLAYELKGAYSKKRQQVSHHSNLPIRFYAWERWACQCSCTYSMLF